MYRLEYSDDEEFPPSTPERPSRAAKFASPNVSTTPAGPPPSGLTGQSTTPAGPPPASSLFGSNKIPAPTFSSHSQYSRNVPSSPPPLVQSAEIRDDSAYDFDDMMDEDAPLDDVFMSYPSDSQDQRSLKKHAGFDINDIAKSLAAAPCGLREDSSLILDTQRLVEDLWHNAIEEQLDPVDKDLAISSAVEHLVRRWYGSQTTKLDPQAIGPGADAPSVTKAAFLSSLLLPLHHQPTRRARHGALEKKPIPEVLIDWLRDHHWPFRTDLAEVVNFRPNCAAHERFWDCIYSAALHCDLGSVILLLTSADFGRAATSFDDGADDLGYQGRQLANTKRVIAACVDTLELCPAVQNGDFNTKNAEWAIFRKRVHSAMSELEAFAEGTSADRYALEDTQTSRFGTSSAFGDNLSLSQKSRRAESQVPWTVYQNLRYLYGQLLGTRSELLAASADWLEASLACAIWWDGEEDEDEDIKPHLSAGRRLLTRSGSERLVDARPQEAYLKKLSTTIQAFLGAPTDENEQELQVDTADPLAIGLACALSGDIEGLLGIMKGWSTVISTAVVEIADAGAWLGSTSGRFLDNFNQSDLMVLSYGGQKSRGTDHDEALIYYAGLLSKKAFIETTDRALGRQGWQVAIEVLGRMHDRVTAMQKISELVDGLEITDSLQVDETSRLCQKLGLEEHARRIAMRYADYLVSTSTRYGESVFYYGRGRAPEKIKDMLGLLTTLSIVQSTAYPAAADLDQSMADLLRSPRQTIARLRQLEPDSADTLLSQISGYATVRKFYAARDDPQPGVPARARRKQTAALLVALVESASDAIHGGLYDARVAPAVPVDALLALLGEALPFLGQPRRTLAPAQLLALLKAVEDLSAAGPALRARCEATLRAALRSAHGSPPPSPRATLRRAASSGAATAFSLVGDSSGELARSRAAAESDSGVLVPAPARRAWDWRAGLARDAPGEDVVKMLRLQIAREMAAGWAAPAAQ